MFVGLANERIYLLLEWQMDADANPERCVAFSTECAPSFAACINPGPPPLIMSQPIFVSSAASSFT
jgi:hypothetical protein